MMAARVSPMTVFWKASIVRIFCSVPFIAEDTLELVEVVAVEHPDNSVRARRVGQYLQSC